MSLVNKVQQLNIDANLLRQIVNGGPEVIVQTEGGPVPSVARVVAQAEAILAELAVLGPDLASTGGANMVRVSTGETVEAAVVALRLAIAQVMDYLGNGLTTNQVVEGNRLYHTAARVLGTALADLSLVSGSAVTAADTVLVAIGKLQKQLNNMAASLEAATRKTGDIVMSARSADFPAPAWLRCNGSTYLRTSYPALAALIGAPVPMTKESNISVGGSETSHVSFSPDGQTLAVSSYAGSPYWDLWYRSGSSWASATVMSKTSAAANCTKFTPDNTVLAIGTGASPYVLFASRTSAGVFRMEGSMFTAYPDAGVNRIDFSPDSQHMAVAHSSGKGLRVFKRVANGINWDALPIFSGYSSTTNGLAVAFSKDGQHLAHGHAYGLEIYKRAGDTYTKLSLPADAAPGSLVPYDMKYSPGGEFLVIVGNQIMILKRTGDTYALWARPPIPAGGLASYGVDFTADGQYMTIALTGVSAGSMAHYLVDGGGFSPLPLPSVLPSSGTKSVSYSPNGQLLAFARLGGVDVYALAYDPAVFFQTPVIQSAFMKS